MDKRKRNRPDKDGKDRTLFNYYKARMKAIHPPCAICGQPINYELPSTNPWSFTVDHIVPISRGGGTTEDNLQPAHRKCNRAKGEKLFLLPEEIYKLRLEQGARLPMPSIHQGDTPKGEQYNPLYDPNLSQAQRGLPQSVNWRTY